MVFPEPPSTDWMRALADHYATARETSPTDELCVVFDIDGTILDLRHLVVHVLMSYDRDRGSDLFHGLVSDDIEVSENQIDELLERLDVLEGDRNDVASFYREHLWDEGGVLAASAPYRGVLGVIRWFQIQPGTHVALNTGRPRPCDASPSTP
ncbi:MAG: HAD family hydrolase [Actinomycetota bacterium]